MLAADRPASAAARRLHLQRVPQTLAVLRGSAAGVAPAEDRGPAGEGLDGRGCGRGRRRWLQQLRGQRLGGGGGGRERPPAELPVHCPAPHRARAVRRAAASVGREAAATGALMTESRYLIEIELWRRVVVFKKKKNVDVRLETKPLNVTPVTSG